MQNKRNLILILLAIVAAGLIAYFLIGRKSTASAKIVPRNSAIVVSFNLKSIFSKAEMNEVKKMDFFHKAMEEIERDSKELKELIQKSIDDPSNTGLDYSDNAYFFVSGGKTREDMRAGFTMAISNKSKFEKFLNELTKSKKPEIKTEREISYISPDSRFIIGWNQDALLILGGEGADLKKSMTELMSNTKEDNKITSNNRFASFAKASHDIGFFYDGNQMYSMMNGWMPRGESTEQDSAMKQLKEYYQGQYGEMLINFENDKVAFKINQYFDDPKKEKEMEQIYSKRLDKGMLNAITPDNILAISGIAINMDAVWKFIYTYPNIGKEVDKMLDQMAEKTGVEKAKLKTLLTGDLTAAITDIKPMRKKSLVYDFPTLENGDMDYSNPQTRIETKMDLTAAYTVTLGVKDQESLNKILNNVLRKSDKMYFYEPESGMVMYFVPTKAGLTMTNDSAMAVTLADKGQFSATPKASLTKLITDNNFGAYIELNAKNLPEKTRNNIIQSAGEEKYNRMVSAIGPLENITVWSNNNKGEMELNIAKKPGHNSLYTLLKHIDDQTKK